LDVIKNHTFIQTSIEFPSVRRNECVRVTSDHVCNVNVKVHTKTTLLRKKNKSSNNISQTTILK